MRGKQAAFRGDSSILQYSLQVNLGPISVCRRIRIVPVDLICEDRWRKQGEYLGSRKLQKRCRQFACESTWQLQLLFTIKYAVQLIYGSMLESRSIGCLTLHIIGYFPVVCRWSRPGTSLRFSFGLITSGPFGVHLYLQWPMRPSSCDISNYINPASCS